LKRSYEGIVRKTKSAKKKKAACQVGRYVNKKQGNKPPDGGAGKVPKTIKGNEKTGKVVWPCEQGSGI